MQSLVDSFIRYKHWLLFFLLEAVSLVELFSIDGYQRNVYFTTANGIVGSIYSAVSSVTSYLNLQDENKRLEQEGEQMRREIILLKQQLREAKHETVQSRILPPHYNLVGAQVVNATVHRSNNFITINRGTRDGVLPEMGVVCSQGVVGVVHLASEHYAVVMPLQSVNSKISCRLRRSEYFGTLKWRHGRSDITYATGIPRHAKVKKGEVVETNGFSDIFPAGIPIGYVMKIEDSADGMSFLLKVGLFANIQTLREVSVITDYQSPERQLLEQKADSLLTE